MSGPLKAGNRLAQDRRARRGGGRATAGAGSSSAAEAASGGRGADQGRGSRKKPARRGFWRFTGGFLARSLYRLAVLGILVGLIGGGGLFLYFSTGLPSVKALRHYQPPLETRIYASDFKLIGALGTQNRIYVPYHQIPPVVQAAFISAEDRSFWSEPGIDPLAIVRAGFVDMTRLGTGERPLGASTITMQVVKNMLLDNRIDFTRKIKEAILAVRVDRAMTKQQILTIYLNEIYLGQNSWGVAAAAQAYFDKPLSRLTIAEAASLGGLPKAPTNYNPFLHPKRALRRRNWVINRMRIDGAITAAQAQQAEAEPLLPEAAQKTRPVLGAGYFSDAVQAQLIKMFGRQRTMEGGLIVRTSMVPRLQTAAMTAMRDRLERYDHQFGAFHGPIGQIPAAKLADWPKALAAQATPPGIRRAWRFGVVLHATPAAAKIGWLSAHGAATHTGLLTQSGVPWNRMQAGKSIVPLPRAINGFLRPGDLVMIAPGAVKPKNAAAPELALEQIPHVEGSMLSMDPRTGRVLAMVGGWSHAMSPYNRALQAHRQPGSGVKPFDYLTAMQVGLQPDATILDAPFVQQLSDGQVYRPGDYEMTFLGPVPVFYALEQSLNLATLHMARRIGLANIASNFEKFGIVHHMPLIYPAVIGALDTTLWRMVRGDAALAEYGRQVTPSLIDSVTAPDGHILYQAPDQVCGNCTEGSPSQPPVLQRPGARLAGPDSVYQVIMMMRNVTEHGTGVPAMVGINRPVAGKTGTTNNFNDAWFVGFVPQMVTGCWIGYDTPRDLGNNQTGGNVCGPAWNQYMRVALHGQPVVNFRTPPGMTLAQVSYGSQTVTEAFKPGQTPGAQSNLGLVADNPVNGSAIPAAATASSSEFNPSPGASPTTGPAANAANGNAPPPVDKSLGGLY
jgi:penicillin-binding protein 1A